MSGDWHFLETEGRAGDVMLHKFFPVLDAFDAEEGETEDHREDEARDQQCAAGGLCGPDREDYGQTAADEYGGVGGAVAHVDGFAGGGEIREIPAAVNQVGAEQAAEKHDFGGEEDPHSQAGGIALLLGLGEVVQERRVVGFGVKAGCGGAIGQRGPPRCGVRLCPASPALRSCRLPRSRRVLLQS